MDCWHDMRRKYNPKAIIQYYRNPFYHMIILDTNVQSRRMTSVTLQPPTGVID